MSVAKVTEIIASSKKSFEDAVDNGIKRAGKTLKGINSAWVKDQSVLVKNGKVSEYRVNLMVTFILAEPKTSKKRKTAGKKKPNSKKKPASKKKTVKKK